MGVAGNLNDNADITTDVRHYWPNDYGLYNMAFSFRMGFRCIIKTSY